MNFFLYVSVVEMFFFFFFLEIRSASFKFLVSYEIGMIEKDIVEIVDMPSVNE